MTYATQYLLRVFVVRGYGLGAAGIFQASSTLSVVYVHIILNAMLTDFYPRLSAAAHDHDQCRSLINDQVQVGLLLAVPGILAIMALAPAVISILYSSRFLAAVEILRWQILGVVLQVVAWPMGFLLRAKGDAGLFFWSELFANAVHLLLAWAGLSLFGLTGIGMAFFGMNLLYLALIWWIVRRSYGFSFTRLNLRLGGACALLMAAVFITSLLFSRYACMIVGSVVAVLAGLYALKRVDGVAGGKLVPAFLVKLKKL
jgi:PST family polysaccharide transporter